MFSYKEEDEYMDEEIQNVPLFDPNNVNISFNGCGFLGIYHVGVAAALRAYVPNMRISVVCGASAGAIAAVCLLGNVPCGKFTGTLDCFSCYLFFLQIKLLMS